MLAGTTVASSQGRINVREKNKKEINLKFQDGRVYAKHIPQSAKVTITYPDETVELPGIREHESSCNIILECDLQSLRVTDLDGARLVVESDGEERVWE